MDNKKKEAIIEALANVELEDLHVSKEAIKSVIKDDKKLKLTRTKGENKNGRP